LTVTPPIRMSLGKGQVNLVFPPDWLTLHPLTIADLEQEAGYLGVVDINLAFK